MPYIERDRLDWLMRQMSQGWRVEAPVIERMVYTGASEQASAFEFVLRHDGAMQVVAVPDCPELHRFLEQHMLSVITL